MLTTFATLGKRTITGIMLGLAFFLLFVKLPPICFSVVLGLVLVLIITTEWPRLFDVRSYIFWLLMPAYPVLPFLCMISMNQNARYHDLLLLLFVMVPAHDTGSYIFGSLFGRTKIAPTISQGKTWEGFLGGYVTTCLIFFMVLWAQGFSVAVPFFLLFTFIICLVSLIGDLFESWLKRRVNIKDSGSLLPGHGGLLDRFDGIMFAALVFFVLKDCLLQYIVSFSSL